MNHYIYYFSGTGNSLYIAKELHKLLPESILIPVVNEIILDKIEVNADLVGFIFPIHAFSLPIPVKKFLKKVTFLSSPYIYAIATRGGAPCNVFHDMMVLLKNQSVQLNAYFFIDMPNNFTHVAKTPEKDEIIKLNTLALKEVETITEVIRNKGKFYDKIHNRSFIRKKILFPVLSVVLKNTGYLKTDKKFYAEPACSGCGLCSKLCPVNRIVIVDGKPHWNNNSTCIFCFACFNYCPNKAIQIKGSKSAIKGRYYNPMIAASEISFQKIPR